MSLCSCSFIGHSNQTLTEIGCYNASEFYYSSVALDPAFHIAVENLVLAIVVRSFKNLGPSGAKCNINTKILFHFREYAHGIKMVSTIYSVDSLYNGVRLCLAMG